MEAAMVTRAVGKSCGEKSMRLGTPSEEQVARKEDMFCKGSLFGIGLEVGRRMLSSLYNVSIIGEIRRKDTDKQRR
jgi:hypothetical protein